MRIANSLSKLDGKNIISTLKNFQDNISGILFGSVLFKRIDEYQHISIDNLKMNDEEFVKSLNYLVNNDSEFDIFNKFFISKIKISHQILVREIIAKSFGIVEEIISSLEDQTTTYNLKEINLLVLSSGWHDKDHANLASSLDKIREEHPLNFICLLLLNSIETNTNDISDIIKNTDFDVDTLKTPDFHDMLEQYLLFSFSFENIMLAIDDSEVTEYILAPVKSLLEKNKISRINILEFVKNNYPILHKLYGDELVLSFFRGWDEPCSKKIKGTMKNDIEIISSQFIEDLLQSNQLPVTKKTIIDIAKNKINESKNITALFTKIDNNLEIVLKHCAQNAITLINSSNNSFVEWFTEKAFSELPKSNYIRLIFDILSDKDKKSTIDNLIDLVYQRDFDIKKQIFLIEYFGDKISLNDSDKNLINRTIIRLFPHSIDSLHLSEWLDNQNFNFTRWKLDDKEIVQNIILSNPEKFPKNAKKLLNARKRKKQI